MKQIMENKHDETSTVLVKVKNLRTFFPVTGGVLKRTIGYVRALDGVDLTIEEGEIHSIVGESGCGKSTLGNSILGLTQPTDGTVELEGQAIDITKPKSWNTFRKDFQIIFQDPYTSLNPRMTVFETIAEPMIAHKICNKKEARGQVVELLETVGLRAEHMERFPHAFSGGQRQRIGIARALGLNPRMIVCDEIVAALDVSVQAQIVHLLLKLKEKFKLSLMFITHDLSLVRAISDRISVMYLGKIVETASVEELFSRPQHPYTEALMASIPTLDRRRRPAILGGEVPSPMNPPSGCSFHPRCRYAQDRCRTETPLLMDTSADDRGHETACFFPLGEK